MRWLAALLPLLSSCTPDAGEADRSAANMADAVGSVGSPATSAEKQGTLEDAEEGATVDLTGRWVGVEGTYAQVERIGPGKVRVTMQYDLDHRGTYEGTRIGDTIVLSGRPEGRVVLTHGSGAQTGMKWIDPAADCLTATVGREAYCRPLS